MLHPRAFRLWPSVLRATSSCPNPDKSLAWCSFVRNLRGERLRGGQCVDHTGLAQPLPARELTQRPLSPLPLLGKKCTYGIKCKFYHPERPNHAQLPVADELRAQTRTWRGAGATDEERPRARAEQDGPWGAPATSWPGPREPGSRSLPPLRQTADVAGVEGGLSRLTFSDDPGLLGAPPPGPGCCLAPRPRCPDWVAPRASLSLPALPGLSSSHSPSGPLVRPLAGDLPRDPQSDLLPERRPLADPWALPHGAARIPGHSAWAEVGWGDGAFWGPLGSTPRAADGERDARARARSELCSIFPAHQVDSVMALFPALSDVTRLILLIQRFQRFSAPLGNP